MQRPVSEPINFAAMPNENENKIDLGEILATLRENKWLIGLITLLMLLLGVAITFIAHPVYKTDAMLQVEAQSLSLTTLEPGGPVVKNEIPVAAEIELLNSRLVLGRAVENLKLDIIAKPIHFPVIGEAIARRYVKKSKDQLVATPWFNLGKYAWGGEVIKVDTFNMPPALMNKSLKLITGKTGEFKIYDEEEDEEILIIQGEVGKLSTSRLEDPENTVSVFISQLIARPGTEFHITKLRESDAILALKNNLQAAEKGKLTPDYRAILGSTQRGIGRQDFKRNRQHLYSPKRRAEIGRSAEKTGVSGQAAARCQRAVGYIN